MQMVMLDRVLWLLLAAGHVLPALSAFRPEMLVRLYGMAPGGDLALLMRHRGLLFLAVVIVAVWAAFDPAVRGLAAVVLATSVAGFLILYMLAGSPPGLRQIAIVDMALLPVLAFVVFRLARP